MIKLAHQKTIGWGTVAVWLVVAWLDATGSGLLLAQGAGLSPQYQSDTLTLKQAFAAALDHNYGIRIARSQVELADVRVSRGNAGMLPSLGVSAGALHNEQDTKLEFLNGETLEVNGAATNNLNASLALNWTLFDGFRMFVALDRLEQLRTLTEVQQQLVIENTLAQVAQAYYETVRQQALVELAREAITISQDRLRLLETRAEYGAALTLELLNARVDLNADSAQLLQAQLGLSNTQRSLNYLLGRPMDRITSVDRTLGFDQLYQLPDLREQAFSRNTSVNQAIQNQKLSQHDYDLVKSQLYPVLGMSAGYGWNQTQTDAGFVTFNRALGWNVGLTARLNLFNGLQTRNQLQQAKLQIYINQLQYDDVRLQVSAALENAYATFVQQLSLVNLAQSNLQTAALNFQVSEERFKLGQVSSLAFREAQLNLLLAKQRIIDAKVNAKQSETELLRVSGGLLSK
jgi:outer membrane protein TolC